MAATAHALPSFTGITPAHGPLCASSFPIQFAGSNIVAGSYSIELEDSLGTPTYPVAPPVVTTPQVLNVQFDLTGLSPGPGTVSITPSGGPTYSFAFTIDPCSGGSGMQVRVFGSSVTSPARPWQYVLSVMNFGPGSSTATTVQVDGIPNPEMTLVAPAGSTVIYPTPATQGFTINVPVLASGTSADYVFELTPDFSAVGFTYPVEAEFTSVYTDNVAFPIQVVASQDPNDKSGPMNADGTFCVRKDALLPYTISFENTPGASAPAQRVVITDQLDLLRVDASSFQFGPITFGNQLVTPPFGVNPFTLTVPYDVDGNPLTISDNLDVQIDGSVDVNGLVTWVFQSLDPLTGMPPSNPLVGFLPANVTPPEGQGSVSFTILPVAGLVDGDIIANSAEIFFDLNPSILTGTWQNTIADGASIILQPTSVIANLGDLVSFQVVVTGFAVTYQWKKNGIDLVDGANIFGTTTDMLFLTSIGASDAGCYTVEITDCAGTVISDVASLNSPPPLLNCASDKTVNCDSLWDFDAPTPVSPLTEVTVTSTETNGSCPQLITRIWTATNACGESLSCTQTVTVVQLPPQLTCIPNKTVECNSVWSFDAPTLTDTCPVTNQMVTMSILSTVTNGTCPQHITRTWQAVDFCGNSVTCAQTVTVVDTQPPVIIDCLNPLQNLVPNPSFENPSGCPSTFTELALAVPWFQPSLGTPDYFHNCGNTSFGVPVNIFGNEPANTGLGYGGGHMFSNEYREYLATPLLAPLAPGQTYQVSFYVSLSELSGTAVDNLGAYISVGPTTDFTTVDALPVTPQIQNSAGVFLSSFNGWMLISGSYTAVGGENYLIIGNFYNNAGTPNITVGTPGAGAYYFVDDVSVIGDCVPYPSTKTVNCDSDWDFDLPTAVDNCSGTNVIITTLSTVTNSSLCPMVITRTWNISDLCGNSISVSQTVTVVDTTPPVLTQVQHGVGPSCGSCRYVQQRAGRPCNSGEVAQRGVGLSRKSRRQAQHGVGCSCKSCRHVQQPVGRLCNSCRVVQQAVGWSRHSCKDV